MKFAVLAFAILATLFQLPADEIHWIKGGHAGLPGAIALSPSGNLLASVGEIYDRTVKLWNAGDGGLLRTFGDHSDRVNAVVFSPDGELVATAGRDAVPRIWRVADGSLVSYFHGRGDWINGLAFSPDGQFLASSSYSYGVQVWRVSDAKLVHTFPTGLEGAVGLSFAPEGQELLVNVRFDKVLLYDPQTGGVLPSFLNQVQLAAASFSPGGDVLLGIPIEDPSTIRRYSFPAGELIDVLESSATGLTGASYTEDGTQIISVGSGKVDRWDASSGERIGEPLDIQREIYGFQISTGLNRIWTVANVAGIEAWNLDSGELEHSVTWHRTGISGVRFLQDGQTLVSASLDGTVKFWRATDGLPLKSFSYQLGELAALVLDPVADQFAIAAGSHVGLYSSADGTLVRSYVHGFQLPRALAISSDGESLYAGGYFSGQSIVKWKVSNGETQLAFRGSNHGTHDLALSPDGDLLATGGQHRAAVGPGLVVDYGEAALWNASTGAPVGQATRSYRDYGPRVAFSKDGSAFGIAGNYWSSLNDATTGEPIWGRPGSSTALAFSSDGRFVAHAVGTIQICRVADGSVVGELSSESMGVSAIVFSPDDKQIAWARGDGTLVVAANPAFEEPPGYSKITRHVVLDNRVELTIGADPSRYCLVLDSADLAVWSPIQIFTSKNAPTKVLFPLQESSPGRYFKVVSLALD